MRQVSMRYQVVMNLARIARNTYRRKGARIFWRKVNWYIRSQVWPRMFSKKTRHVSLRMQIALFTGRVVSVGQKIAQAIVIVPIGLAMHGVAEIFVTIRLGGRVAKMLVRDGPWAVGNAARRYLYRKIRNVRRRAAGLHRRIWDGGVLQLLERMPIIGRRMSISRLALPQEKLIINIALASEPASGARSLAAWYAGRRLRAEGKPNLETENIKLLINDIASLRRGRSPLPNSTSSDR